VWLLLLGGLLLALQIVLQLACLYGIWSMPSEHLRGHRKWPWVLVVVIGGLLGCLAYLLAARASVSQRRRPPGTGGGERAPRPTDPGRRSHDHGRPVEPSERDSDDWGYYDPNTGE
jgi:hypothetical protein